MSRVACNSDAWPTSSSQRRFGGSSGIGGESSSCRVLHALSGEMNAVRLVFVYPDLGAYEQEEARDAADPEYARVAAAMPFVEGTLAYEIYREVD